MIIDREKCKDTALVFSFASLILYQYLEQRLYLTAAFILLLIALLFPLAMKPVATVWFKTAEVLNKVMSKILLTLIFYFIVSPLAIVRKVVTRDELQIRKWPTDEDSMLVDRKVRFSKEELKHPF